MGDGVACGLREKKRDRLLRESTSAEKLRAPRMWLAVIETLWAAPKKMRERRMCMSCGSRAEPLFIA